MVTCQFTDDEVLSIDTVIIDEEEVEEAEAKERFFQNLFVGLLFLWLILDPESLFDLVGSIVF